MNDPSHEWLSAYLDDEVPRTERTRGSRELSRNPGARRRLGRYQLIGDALREELPERLCPGFARKVHQAIAREDSSPPPSRILQDFRHGIRSPVPLAAASGMLALTAAGWLWFHAPNPDAEAPVAQAPTGHAASAEEHRRIMSYLAAHAEVEPRALMPYIQLVEYEQ